MLMNFIHLLGYVYLVDWASGGTLGNDQVVIEQSEQVRHTVSCHEKVQKEPQPFDQLIFLTKF